MVKVFRRDGIYLRRFWWWYPWHLTRWWLPGIWRGSTEWCDRPVCLTLPPLGCFLVFVRPLRATPCDECWGEMDEEQRAGYLPGGTYYLESR